MRVNEYGQVLRTEKEVIDLLYQNPELDFKSINVESESVDRFNQSAKLCNAELHLNHLQRITDNPAEFDKKNHQDWFMPEDYYPNLVEMLYGCCETDAQRNRVSEELQLFIQHGMLDLVFYLKYLVDTLRANNIVWGVGRGSSVASYVLFILGVHKVDSLKYNLDIHEFLK